MGFSRQEYWNGLPFPLPGYLPDPGVELVPPAAPALQADSLPLSPQILTHQLNSASETIKLREKKYYLLGTE